MFHIILKYYNIDVKSKHVVIVGRSNIVGKPLFALLGQKFEMGNATVTLCHTGTLWTNETRDRLCLFTCYNTINAKWGKACPPQAVIESFPPKRQTLFRGIWHGMGEVPGINKYYDEANTGRFG